MLKRLLDRVLRQSTPRAVGDSVPGEAPPAVANTMAGADHLRLCLNRAAQRAADGDHAAAASLYREILQLRPQEPWIWCNLGAALDAIGQADEAERAYREALEVDPGLAQAWYNLGRLQQQRAKTSEAENCYRSALGLLDAVRDHALWQLVNRNLGLLLQRAGRLQDAANLYRAALEAVPADAGLRSNLLYTLNRSGAASAQQVLAEHRAWAAAHADELTLAARANTNSPEPERVLRIGYVSADFREHALAYFIEPVLRFHDRARYQVYCYFTLERSDEVTHCLRQLADHWRDIAGLSDDAAAHLVREDGVDILIDLSGHTLGNRLLLFARKPAPIQMTWLGYLGTTGMQAMDYLISDACADPPGVADADYSETLLRLPHCRWCYQPPAHAPAVNELPAIARGFVTYGSFNNFSKLSDETLRAWGRLLQRVPNARLRLIGVAELENCDRALEILEDEGVFADRVEAVGWLTHHAYLEQHREIDVALDAYPYNGATTACHSLWMGVPVVSLCGRSGAARSGASILTNTGLAHLIAHSWDEYIDIAQGLAADVSALAGLRATLRGRVRASPLMDAPGFTRDLEALCRAAWCDWCTQINDDV